MNVKNCSNFELIIIYMEKVHILWKEGKVEHF